MASEHRPHWTRPTARKIKGPIMADSENRDPDPNRRLQWIVQRRRRIPVQVLAQELPRHQPDSPEGILATPWSEGV